MIDTLGKLKDELQQYSEQNNVLFDCLPLVQPTMFDSWRGRYEELALGYEAVTHTTPNVTVGELLDRIKSANGKTFVGWKGGEYMMNYHTGLWVENRGCYTGMRIKDTRFNGQVVLLRIGS